MASSSMGSAHALALDAADAGDDEASGIPPAFAAPEPTEAPAPVDGSDEEADAAQGSIPLRNPKGVSG